MTTDRGEPEFYQEVMIAVHQDERFKAMQEEMNSLHENHTYDLVLLPKGRKALRINGCISSRPRTIAYNRDARRTWS